MSKEICPNYYRKKGCQSQRGKACPRIEVKRAWSGNGDSFPVACHCGLIGEILKIGFHIERRSIPPPKNPFWD